MFSASLLLFCCGIYMLEGVSLNEMELVDILSTFPNQSDINDFCNYTEYFKMLSFYEIKPFEYDVDYKKLNNVYELFGQLTSLLFRTPILDYINIVIDMFQSDTFSPSVLVEYQLPWFAVLGMLALVFVILILGVLMTVVKTIFAAGKPEDCYQKINPANDYIINFLGMVMLISAIVVMMSSLIGYLGNNQVGTVYKYPVYILYMLTMISIIIVNMYNILNYPQYSNIKDEYGVFAKDVKLYIDSYVNNITNDMKVISSDEFEYLSDKMQKKLLFYHEQAAKKVKNAEKKAANKYLQLAGQIENKPVDMDANILLIKQLMDTAWTLSASHYDSLDTCYKGLESYCAEEYCAPDVDNPGEYKLDPNDIKPVSLDEFNKYNTESLQPFRTRLFKIKGTDIPGFTRANNQIWSATVERLMVSNKPQRDLLKKSFDGLRDWLKRSIAKAILVKNGWEVTMASYLPTNEKEYEASSTLDLTLKYEAIVSSIMFSASLLLAVFCCGLYMLGMCNRVKGVLPTERSEASQFVAKGMSVTLGVMFILNLVSMVLAITHYVPSTVLSKMCQEVNVEQQNPFQIWDQNKIQNYSIMSTAVGDTTSNVTFMNFLKDCKENKSLYVALNLSNVWDLKRDFAISQFLDYKRYTQNSGLENEVFEDNVGADHWGVTYYSEEQLKKIYKAGNRTQPSNTDDLKDIIPLISDRGIVKVLDTELDDFKAALDIAVLDPKNSAGTLLQLQGCVLAVDTWFAHGLNTTMGNTYNQILTKLNHTLEDLAVFQHAINETINKNTEIFKRSASTYMITMVEALSEMDKEVECYGDIASHQYSYVLGRCRPLWDTYQAINNFVCGRAGKTFGILMLAFLMNFIIVTLFSVSILLLIPHFKKMTRLHPDDNLKFEREQIAKADPKVGQDDDKI